MGCCVVAGPLCLSADHVLAEYLRAPGNPDGAAGARLAACPLGSKMFRPFHLNEGGETTAAEMGTRSPTCFGITGKYFGAYSYASLTGGTVSVPLSLGRHNVFLLALDKTEECSGKDLAYFFPGTGDASEAYAVGNSGEVDITATTTEISVVPDLYGEPPTNLTSLCPQSGAGCTGSLFCDTFTGNDVSLSLHLPDVGNQTWTISGSGSARISGNRADVTADSGGEIYVTNDAGTTEVSLSATITMGSSGFGSHNYALLARYSDNLNYLAGKIVRFGTYCTTSIFQRRAAIDYTRVTSNPFPCSANVPYEARLVANGFQLEFTLNGTTIQYSQAALSTSGTYVGVYNEASGGLIFPTLVDDFIVRAVP